MTGTTRERNCKASGHACGGGDRSCNQHEESWRLLDTTLFAPLNPLRHVAVLDWPDSPGDYGATNQKFGGAGSLYDIFDR